MSESEHRDPFSGSGFLKPGPKPNEAEYLSLPGEGFSLWTMQTDFGRFFGKKPTSAADNGSEREGGVCAMPDPLPRGAASSGLSMSRNKPGSLEEPGLQKIEESLDSAAEDKLGAALHRGAPVFVEEDSVSAPKNRGWLGFIPVAVCGLLAVAAVIAFLGNRKDLKRARSDIAGLQTHMTSLQGERDKLHEGLNTLSEQKNILSSDLEAVRSDNARLGRNLAKLQSNLKTTRGELNAVTNRRDQLTRELQDLNASLEKTIAAHQSEKSGLNERLMVLAENNSSLKELIEGQKGSLAEVRTRLAETENRLRDAMTEVGVAREKAATLEQTRVALKSDLAKESRKNQDLEARIQEQARVLAANDIGALEKEVAALHEENKSLKDALRIEKQRLAQVEQQLDDAHQTIAALEQEKEQLIAERGEMENQLTAANSEIEQLQSLRTQGNARVEARAAKLEEKNKSLGTELEDLRKRLSSAAANQGHLKAQNSELEATVSSLNSKLSEALEESQRRQDQLEDHLSRLPGSTNPRRPEKAREPKKNPGPSVDARTLELRGTIDVLKDSLGEVIAQRDLIARVQAREKQAFHEERDLMLTTMRDRLMELTRLNTRLAILESEVSEAREQATHMGNLEKQLVAVEKKAEALTHRIQTQDEHLVSLDQERHLLLEQAASMKSLLESQQLTNNILKTYVARLKSQVGVLQNGEAKITTPNAETPLTQ